MSKKPGSAPSFFSRYLVTVVMVPAIIAFHIGWSALQKNKTLVGDYKEIDLPVVTFYKYCLRKLSGSETQNETVTAKAEN